MRSLQYDELMVLEANFERSWSRLYSDLRDTVCAALECDYYGEDAELDRVFNEKMKRAKRKLAATLRSRKTAGHQQTVSSA